MTSLRGSRFVPRGSQDGGPYLSRHCEPTGRANARPMTGSAKQSIWRQQDECGFASSLSLLAMTNSTRLILPAGQITSDFQKSCQAPFAKIFLFSPDPNQFTDSPCPVSTRGALRTSSTRGGMRWTRLAHLTNGADADGEVVWFRRPNRWRQACEKKRRRRCQKAWSPRRARSKP